MLVTIGLYLALWTFGLGFQTEDGLDAVLDARGGQREIYEKASEAGNLERTLFIDVACPEVFSTEGLSLIGDVTNAFLSLEHVAGAKSLTHAFMPVREGFSFGFEPLIPPPPWSPEQLARLKEFCLEHPLIRDAMVAGSGNRALIAVEYEAGAFATATPEKLRNEARQILEAFDREDVQLRMLGAPFAELEIREAVKTDLLVLGGGALLLAMAVLRIALLGWRLTFVLLVAHLLYLSLLPGLARLVGYRPEPFAMALFPLLGAIQLTLLAHIGSAFVRALADGRKRTPALQQAVGETCKACLFATLTTMAGCLSLSISATESIRQLGLWGAAGVGTGFLFTFGPAVSILSLAGGFGAGPAQVKKREQLHAVQQHWHALSIRLAAFARRHARLLAGSAAVFTIATLPGLFLLKPDVRLDSFLPEGSQIREAIATADSEYGGIHFAQIDFDTGRPGGVSERPFLEFLWAMHRKAEAIPEITVAYSYPQVLAVLNQVWHGGDPDALRFPEEDWLLTMLTGGLKAFDLPLLDTLTDADQRTAHLILRMPRISSARYLEVVEQLMAEARASAPPDVTVAAGGMVHEFLAADRAVVRAQFLGSLLAAAAIGILLLILWRSPSLMLKALTVTIFPVLSVLGLAGYAGLRLNSITVMAGAIAAGIAVDDVVHFITCWRDARRRLNEDPTALEETLFMKGPPILFTSLILIGGFLLLRFSAFEPVGDLGLLSAGALALTLPAIVFVLPGLLGRGTTTNDQSRDQSPSL